MFLLGLDCAYNLVGALGRALSTISGSAVNAFWSAPVMFLVFLSAMNRFPMYAFSCAMCMAGNSGAALMRFSIQVTRQMESEPARIPGHNTGF